VNGPPLLVFNQCNGNRIAVFHLTHHGRYLVQAGQLRGAPAAFTGNNFITTIIDTAYHDRLYHTCHAE
jgi:hypothetical protein